MTLADIRERVESPSPHWYEGVEGAIADRAELLKRLDALVSAANELLDNTFEHWETNQNGDDYVYECVLFPDEKRDFRDVVDGVCA